MRVHGFRNACIINIKSQHADVIHVQMYMSYDLTRGFMNFFLVDAWMKSAKVVRMQQSSCLCSNE